MTLREEKEKIKISRETMGKFFYDLAKASFTAMVIGAMLGFFTTDVDVWKEILLLVVGVVMTTFLAKFGNYILKK